jgi:hypothetical protein
MFVIHVMMKTESTGIYQYFYITLPRKSGKSILLDTVGYFCEDWQLRKGFEAAQKCWVSPFVTTRTTICFSSNFKKNMTSNRTNVGLLKTQEGQKMSWVGIIV